MKHESTDIAVKQEQIQNLIRHSGWKIVENMFESQWLTGLDNFKKAKTFEEFILAQAMVNQVEGLYSQIRKDISGFGKKQVDKQLNLQGE